MSHSASQAVTAICQAIRDAGYPLTRTEVAQRIDPTQEPYLKRRLEAMIKAGILKVRSRTTDQGTSVLVYKVADGVDCGSISIDEE
jgi:hypothetical protein